jgi:hypothetical protein
MATIVVAESVLFAIRSGGELQASGQPEPTLREAVEGVPRGPEALSRDRERRRMCGEVTKSRGAVRLAGGIPQPPKIRTRTSMAAGLTHEVAANRASHKYALEAQTNEETSDGNILRSISVQGNPKCVFEVPTATSCSNESFRQPSCRASWPSSRTAE